jgi:hypothetical protein
MSLCHIKIYIWSFSWITGRGGHSGWHSWMVVMAGAEEQCLPSCHELSYCPSWLPHDSTLWSSPLLDLFFLSLLSYFQPLPPPALSCSQTLCELLIPGHSTHLDCFEMFNISDILQVRVYKTHSHAWLCYSPSEVGTCSD